MVWTRNILSWENILYVIDYCQIIMYTSSNIKLSCTEYTRLIVSKLNSLI